MKKRCISRECMELLAQWVREHCCLLLTEPQGRELLRGLYVIVDDELARALDRQREGFHEVLHQPGCN